MRRLLACLALLLAGCTTVPVPAPDLAAAPVIVAEGATIAVLGDATRVTWEGTADPAGAAPVADPRWPVPRTTQVLARHEFSLGPEVTIAAGNLTWAEGEDFLGFLLVNETGAVWCGAAGGPLASGCVATLHKRRAAAEPWSVVILGDPTAAQGTPVAYAVSFLFQAKPLVPQGPPVRAGMLAFAGPVVVHDEARANEPSIAVTPGGTVYVAALPHANHVWKSEDGATFARIEASDLAYCSLGQFGRIPPGLGLLPSEGRLTHFGCGDIDVATSGEDTVWFSAHWGNEAVSVSQDRGATWTTNVLAAGADAHTDRQWLVTDGPMTAWHVQTSYYGAVAGAVTGAPIPPFTITKTLDGGQSWLPLGRADIPDRQCVSTLARDTAGTLYLGSCGAAGPGVAVSEDGGVTWDWRPGPRREDLGFLIVQVTTDAADNVYLVWTEPPGAGVGTTIAYAWSGDHGATWSAPREVFSQPGTFVLPWATGGTAGHLAVAAYGTRWIGDPQEALGDWYPVAAVTPDALAEQPAWEEAPVDARPNQWGPICLGGNGCAHGRNLADYFQIQADGEGRVHVAYAAANAEDGLRPGVWYARQAAGPTVGGPSVDKNGGP